MIITKAQLLEAMKDVGDNDPIMIQLGGHRGKSLPITGVEDSTSIGFWEIRCDPDGPDFWDVVFPST